MYRNSLFIVLVALILIVNIASANAGSVWQHSVHVCLSSSKFNLARQEAINNNRQISLESVIAKLVPRSSLTRVKNLLNEDSSSFFETKLRINNEQLADNLYSADITYYFDPKKITTFLSINSIPYVVNFNNSLLIIPLTDGKLDPNNLWYKTCYQNRGNFFSKLIIIPNPESIDLPKIYAHDVDYLQQLKQHFAVNNVLVAECDTITNTNSTNDQPSASVNQDQYADTSNNAPPSLSQATLATDNIYNLRIYNLQDNATSQWNNVSLNTALSNTVAVGEEESKKNNLTALQEKDTITLKVSYQSFVDWVAISNYLKNSQQVLMFKPIETSKNYSIIQIKYYGLLSDLAKAASLHNIIIDTDNYTTSCNGVCF